MNDAVKNWDPQFCEDKVFIPASPEAVFDVLLDAARWNEWWETMRFEPTIVGPLKAGDRIVFDGVVSKWDVVVKSIEPSRAIHFDYVEGALLGDTEWRVTPTEGGCIAAYIYHGVRANQDRAANTFGQFGTVLHSMVMDIDALDGLLRRVTGEPLDQVWRQSVRDKVAAGRAALLAERGRSK